MVVVATCLPLRQTWAMAKDELMTQIEFYCRKYQEPLDKVENGLEYFLLHLIAQERDYVDFVLAGKDPNEADLSIYRCAGKDDLRIDGLLYNEELSSVAIIQCAHRAKYGRDVDEKAIAFFKSLGDWINPDIVETGNSEVQDLLIDCALNPFSQKITLYFATTLSVNSDNAKGLLRAAEEAQKQYQEKGYEVECQVLGSAELIAKHTELSNTRDFGLAEKVQFEIQEDFHFLVEEPLRSIVCAIRASALADIYNRKDIKNKLFNQNIRLGITSKINSAISKTATDPEESKNFFYYNNGITATCSEFELDGNRISASNLQVVNGAQTVSALARSVGGGGGAIKKSTNAVVLFRLIETGEQKSRKNYLADNITRYQNTQNPVRESDFFSNEPFQLWLSANLPQELSNRGVVPGFYYQHKRGYKPSSRSGEALTLEKLAQLRHAMYYGPAVSYNSPRLFWDISEPQYWQAFGVEGKECTAWDDSQMSEVGWGIATYLKLLSDAKSLGNRVRRESIKNEESKYLAYLSRYLTAAVFQVLNQLHGQKAIPDFKELISSKTIYDKFCSPIVVEMRKQLMQEMQTAYVKAGVSRLAVARDVPQFDAMVGRVLEMIDSGLVQFN